MNGKILADVALGWVITLDGKPNEFANGPAMLSPSNARTSCSTFLKAILFQTFTLNKRMFGSGRAKDFYEVFVQTPIVSIKDVNPGTLAAIKYDNPPAGMTGHCFVIVGYPKFLHGNQYLVDVVDSCRTGHGLFDTRQGNGGIGLGQMVLLTNADKHIVGYRWSSLVSSVYIYSGKGEWFTLSNVPDTWRLRNE